MLLKKYGFIIISGFLLAPVTLDAAAFRQVAQKTGRRFAKPSGAQALRRTRSRVSRRYASSPLDRRAMSVQVQPGGYASSARKEALLSLRQQQRFGRDMSSYQQKRLYSQRVQRPDVVRMPSLQQQVLLGRPSVAKTGSVFSTLQRRGLKTSARPQGWFDWLRSGSRKETIDRTEKKHYRLTEVSFGEYEIEVGITRTDSFSGDKKIKEDNHIWYVEIEPSGYHPVKFEGRPEDVIKKVLLLQGGRWMSSSEVAMAEVHDLRFRMLIALLSVFDPKEVKYLEELYYRWKSLMRNKSQKKAADEAYNKDDEPRDTVSDDAIACSYRSNVKIMADELRKNKDRSPYEILGLQPGASRKEVRIRYIQWMKEFHPDKYRSGEDKKEANYVAARLTNAWEHLKNK